MEAKCTSFWGHNYQNNIKEEDGHKVKFLRCSNCGHEKDHYYTGDTEHDKFPIYMITAPFGVLYGDVHGSISGSCSGFIFCSGYIGGSISTKLEEAYIVKYMDGNNLKTKKFYSERTALIVDGELYLEHWQKAVYKKNEAREWVQDYIRYSSHEWAIHITELPEVEKLTTKYTGSRTQ